ncbi:MAG: hypothetical protein COA78_24780 [Blastopirellula sp.]|nr:MAG: hypothetical protein COA78_24780 [Blastopirellula sp.]
MPKTLPTEIIASDEAFDLNTPDFLIASNGDEVPGSMAIEAEADLEIQAAQGEGKEKGPATFTMLAYSGGKMRPAGFYRDVVMDLQGCKKAAGKMPILSNHQHDQPVGHAESDGVVISARNINIAGAFSVDSEDSRRIVQSSKDGFPWKASVGASIEKIVFVEAGDSFQANGRTFKGPCFHAQETTLHETSFVTVAGDPKTKTKVKATRSGKDSNMNFEAWLEARFSGIEFDETQLISMKATYEAEIKASADSGTGDDTTTVVDPPKVVEASGGGGATVVDPLLDLKAARLEMVQEDLKISKLQAKYGLDDEKFMELKASHFENEWSMDKLELECSRKSRPSDLGNGGQYSIHATSTVVSHSVAVASIAASLNTVPEEVIAQGISDDDMQKASEYEYRGLGLQSLMRLVLQAAGVTHSGFKVDDDFIRSALQADKQQNPRGYTNLRASSGFTTLSLTNVLGDVANKIMLSRYEAVETIHQYFVKMRDHKDFRPHSIMSLDSKGGYKRVAADGELKHSGLVDSKKTTDLDTFGTVMAITRKDWINDDLGAFAEVTAILGEMSPEAKEEEFFVLLMSMIGGDFFQAGNNNYIDGASSAISVDGLNTVQQMFDNRVKNNKRPILTKGQLIMAGISNYQDAVDFYNDKELAMTTTANKGKSKKNPHKGRFQPYKSAYLSNPLIKDVNGKAIANQSANQFLVFDDPKTKAAVYMSNLNGNTRPTIQSDDTSFTTLGIQYRGFDDFGFSEGHEESAIYSKGEA